MSLAMAVPDKSAAEIVPISWVKRIGSRVCTNVASDGDVCENGPIRTYNLGSRSEADPPTDAALYRATSSITLCHATIGNSTLSSIRCTVFGSKRYGDGASDTG